MNEHTQAEWDLAHITRLLRIVSGINQMIARQSCPDVMLSEACRIFVSTGGFLMAWIGLPGALTEHEWRLLQEHPETAFRILREMRFPGPVARIVRDHHERLDGSGYPQGLAGDEIRVESRILAVADVVEAMSSHRPYRPALGIDAALAEITAQRGVKYDEQVIDACVALFREEGFAFSKAS